MMLYEQGKLNLTDSVGKFLDSIPVAWNKIQVKHLLSHTSGLPDEVPEYFKERYLISYSSDELLQNIKKQELVFQPGDSWLYSDAGFLLLQLIVEKISGMSYGKFPKENILLPLGMYSTQTLNPKIITPNRSASYYERDNGEIIINTYRAVDFGPLYNDIGTTISDFVKYDIAIATNKLLKQETYDMMWTPFILNEGNPVSAFVHMESFTWGDASYGYAWVNRKFKNHRIIYHSGWTGTSITRLPDDNLTVILFTNLHGDFNPDEIARHISALYIPASFYSEKPSMKDPNPATTLFLKEQISKLSTGTIDSIAFTNDIAKALSPALPDFRKRINNLGSLQSFEYLETEKELNNKSKIFYKATYLNGILYYQITITKEKKIDFLSIENDIVF
jgi:CubicO group peptidase (beta-lactamase class C family)